MLSVLSAPGGRPDGTLASTNYYNTIRADISYQENNFYLSSPACSGELYIFLPPVQGHPCFFSPWFKGELEGVKRTELKTQNLKNQNCNYKLATKSIGSLKVLTCSFAF